MFVRAGPGPVDVDPQDLAEESVLVLAVVVGVVAAATVADADVQVAVRPECQRAAVVIRAWVIDAQQRCSVDRSANVRLAFAVSRLTHDVAVARAGVVDVHVPVAREVRVERQPEQAPLPAAGRERVGVEEIPRLQRPTLDDADPPAALDDEQPARAVTGVGDAERAAQAPGHPQDPQLPGAQGGGLDRLGRAVGRTAVCGSRAATGTAAGRIAARARIAATMVETADRRRGRDVMGWTSGASR